MSKYSNAFDFSANFKVKVAGALDPRVVATSKADLIKKENWPSDGDTIYVYKGLIVDCGDDGIYRLKDETKVLDTDYSGWEKINTGGTPSGDLSDYAKITYVDDEVKKAKTYTDEEIAKAVIGDIDLSDYATKEYVNTEISKIPSGGGGASYQGSASIDITDNVISVKEVDSSIVSMQSIPVGGTPLADILTAKGINTINAGNLQSVIESLFSNETWPSNPKRTVPTTATISMSNPTILFNKSIAIVGSTVTLTANTNSASGSVTVYYSGFDNGWSKELNKINTGIGNPSPVSSPYNISRDSGEYDLSFTVNEGFGGATISAASGSNGGAASKEQNLTVAPGNNQVTCTASSPVFKINIKAEPKYYVLSTLKNTSEDHIVAASIASTISNLQKTGVTNDASVTGVYPIYSNAKVYSHTAFADGGNNSLAATTAFNKTDYATSTTISESTLTSLTNGNTKFYTFIGYGKGGFTLQIPSGWKVTEILAKSDSVANTFNGGVGNIPTPTPLTKTFDTYSDTYSQYVFSIQAGNVCRVLIEPKTT